MFADRQQIQEALSRTGRRLALTGAGEFALLVCGGSALNFADLVHRPTRDVDVLASIKGDKVTPATAGELPEEIRRAAEKVAVDLGLPRDWLNDAAMDVQRLGLPPGILMRARRLEFGLCLTVFFIGRRDQVALKLYAAIDRDKGQRHFKDLNAIKPTRAEMDFAVHWLLNRPTSPQFRKAVRSVVKALGFSMRGHVEKNKTRKVRPRSKAGKRSQTST